MNTTQLIEFWKKEEFAAHIHGWDFSHINGRYDEQNDLPWDYDAIVRKYLKDEMTLLDYDTGGGEYLLSLHHPYCRTSATEGYPPNVTLCQETLTPLGIDFRPCCNPSEIPFPNSSFDMMINRHGSLDSCEIYRVLNDGGIFVTEQVGEDNDRDLVKMVLPQSEKTYPNLNLQTQQRAFESAGFEILIADEAYCPITFYDVGAFVWFARIIEWEFVGFSVDRCLDGLLEMQKIIERDGKIQGTIHRFLIAVKK